MLSRGAIPPAVLLALLLAGGALAGCGGARAPAGARPGGRLPSDYVPVGVGPGRAYRPGARIAAVRLGRPVGGLRCEPRRGRRYGAHLEVFAHDRVVAIPAGIGVRPPLAAQAARIVSARCYYPLMSTDATGVIEVRPGRGATLGTLFALWGEPLSRTRVAGFRTAHGRRVIAYVGAGAHGNAVWPGDPRAIPLRRHTRIVLELASAIPPHTTYVFPPGL